MLTREELEGWIGDTLSSGAISGTTHFPNATMPVFAVDLISTTHAVYHLPSKLYRRPNADDSTTSAPRTLREHNDILAGLETIEFGSVVDEEEIEDIRAEADLATFTAKQTAKDRKSRLTQSPTRQEVP